MNTPAYEQEPTRQQTCEFIVSSEDNGQRVDVFLVKMALSLSRSQIQKAVEDGFVLVNHQRIKASHRLRQGETVRLQRQEAKVYTVLPQDIALNIIYEDPHILVVDKPAGMVVHPAAGHYQDTLVNAILHHCRDLSGIGGVLRPGIVHRLDKDTSGLLVVAKSDEAHQRLAEQFQRHEVRKTYKALVYGDMMGGDGIIDSPIGRHPSERKKMSTKSRRSKEAVSRWRVCERYAVATLLDVDIVTGRTHQIRVHLKSIGYPVIGDTIYGGSKKVNALEDAALKVRLKAMKRQALHASRIGFSHPITGGEMSFSSPLPADMADLCGFLKGYKL